jgi:hypothetical protein
MTGKANRPIGKTTNASTSRVFRARSRIAWQRTWHAARAHDRDRLRIARLARAARVMAPILVEDAPFLDGDAPGSRRWQLCGACIFVREADEKLPVITGRSA